MEFDTFDLLYAVVHGHHVEFDISTSNMVAPTPGELWDRIEWRGDMESPPLYGLPELRSQLASLHGGVAEDYLITHGTSEANFLVCAALLRPGDRVIVERPYYHPLVAIPRGLGAHVEFLPRTEDRNYTVDPAAVGRLAGPDTKLVILSNVHNPSGAAMDEDTLQGLADLAHRRHLHVLVDEVFRETAIDGPPPTARGFGDRMIVTSSVSKYQGLGSLRVGWVTASADLLKRVRNVMDHTTVTPSPLPQWLALGALRRVDFFRERTTRIIAANRATAKGWLESHGDRITWAPPAGNIAFPHTGRPMAPVAQHLLEEYSTFIAPGEHFGAPNHFRLALGRPPEVLQRGLANLDRVLA